MADRDLTPLAQASMTGADSPYDVGGIFLLITAAASSISLYRRYRHYLHAPIEDVRERRARIGGRLR